MKNVLLTGASKGLGLAIKSELENHKVYKIIAPARSELDLSSEKSVKYFIRSLPEIDILINNAGINHLKKVEDIDSPTCQEMLSVNLVSPLNLISAVVPKMKEKGWGKIINISSIWGISSKQNRSLYSMTKFGLNGVTKSLARELGPYNILINSVCPGYMDTELTQKNVPEAEQIEIKKTISLQRFAKTSEIAKFVAFLISEENTYITGQSLLIDGGFL